MREVAARARLAASVADSMTIHARRLEVLLHASRADSTIGPCKRALLVQTEAQRDVRGTFDAVDAHFAVPLRGVRVARGKKRARDSIPGRYSVAPVQSSPHIHVAAEYSGRARAKFAIFARARRPSLRRTAATARWPAQATRSLRLRASNGKETGPTKRCFRKPRPAITLVQPQPLCATSSTSTCSTSPGSAASIKIGPVSAWIRPRSISRNFGQGHRRVNLRAARIDAFDVNSVSGAIRRRGGERAVPS